MLAKPMWRIRITCRFLLFAVALAAEKAALHTATFKPGKLGIHADWAIGLVNKLDKGGQGEKLGVKPGMYISEVDGHAYSEALLDKYAGGEEKFKIAFKTPPPPARAKSEDDVPPRPDFKFATELTASTFQEKVVKVTNGSDADPEKPPPYYPVVMFHVSWCKHCRHALPEFEEAAKMLQDSERNGHLQTHEVTPKLFLIECDVPREHTTTCDPYTRASFPVIKIFRDGRELVFNRPRLAQTFAWWAARVSAPVAPTLAQAADVKAFIKSDFPSFALVADTRKDAETVRNWKDVALGYLEEYAFVVVPPSSGASKVLQVQRPGVRVFGKGLEPLPLEGEMTRDNLAKWVSFNQFATVAKLDPYRATGLKRCGFVVVVLVFRGDSPNATSVVEGFAAKARKLRQGRQYLFATIDVAEDDNFLYLEHAFPLLAASNPPLPRVFALRGADTHWEDPAMDVSHVSEESIKKLLANSEALQDGSTWSWVKEKRKLYMRYASSSQQGLVLSISAPLLALTLMFKCIQALMSDDDGSLLEESKVEKVD
mmetsp:Transcript_119313/g.337513  ORF Transcript_119313/g.337513 Transcript_119313/m.337513 type:complete len:541 (-) Transcript_119313:26-1648(-)